MSTEKLSISLDAELATAVREAAAEEGVSVSNWLSQAAEAKARRRRLRVALDEFAAENGALSDADIDRIVADARTRSVVVDSTRTPGP
jgi:hypothetical protein